MGSSMACWSDQQETHAQNVRNDVLQLHKAVISHCLSLDAVYDQETRSRASKAVLCLGHARQVSIYPFDK